MQRLRSRGSSFLGSLAMPHMKRKASRSWVAIQDTYFSAKDIFERHKVVFTVGTSMASVATAWFGYSIRHLRDSKIDRRLESIENAMKSNYHLEHEELRKLVDPGSSHIAASIATVGTSFLIGYGLGWRGGRWYTNRKFKREQMKLLGAVKPKRWQLLGRIKPKALQFQFLKRQLARSQAPETSTKPSGKMMKDASVTHNHAGLHQSC